MHMYKAFVYTLCIHIFEFWSKTLLNFKNINNYLNIQYNMHLISPFIIHIFTLKLYSISTDGNIQFS